MCLEGNGTHDSPVRLSGIKYFQYGFYLQFKGDSSWHHNSFDVTIMMRKLMHRMENGVDVGMSGTSMAILPIPDLSPVRHDSYDGGDGRLDWMPIQG